MKYLAIILLCAGCASFNDYIAPKQSDEYLECYTKLIKAGVSQVFLKELCELAIEGEQ